MPGNKFICQARAYGPGCAKPGKVKFQYIKLTATERGDSCGTQKCNDDRRADSRPWNGQSSSRVAQPQRGIWNCWPSLHLRRRCGPHSGPRWRTFGSRPGLSPPNHTFFDLRDSKCSVCCDRSPSTSNATSRLRSNEARDWQLILYRERHDERQCVPRTQRTIVLVKCQRRTVTFGAGLVVDVFGCGVHSCDIGKSGSVLETQTLLHR